MCILYSLILSIVQGVTEFFPISSSAHLALLEAVFGIKDKLTLTVFLHFGSALAIIAVLCKDIKEIVTKDLQLILVLIIGSIPAGILGFFLRDKIELVFNRLILIGLALVVMGIILWLTSGLEEKRVKVTLLDAILIGIAQGIGIIPGISRSGITISTGIYLGLNRVQAVKFSLLLAIISIIGASMFEIICRSVGARLPCPYLSVIIGIFVSFFASYLSIKYLLKVVKGRNFYLFSIYCWVMGFLILII
ncbi:MAG: undecaprenyl-diphosphate phosphatase [bacterium]|nr:undecaprenyl-diphosphate phosphatase [bacterium]